jgi:hypothetical protein
LAEKNPNVQNIAIFLNQKIKAAYLLNSNKFQFFWKAIKAKIKESF